MKKILTITIFTIITSISFCQPGTLDPSFGVNGESLMLTTNKSSGCINAIEQQTDGKIIAAGEEYYSSITYNPLVVRYKVDGTADSSFGTNGFGNVSIKSDHKYDAATAVKVLSNGKILVVINAQNASTSDPDIYLVRLNTDGSKDTSFGNNGVIKKNIGIDYAYALQVQDDGKILIGGQINSLASLARFNEDGSTDTSFNKSGLILFRSTKYSYIGSIAFTSDHKILAGGTGRSNLSSSDEAFVKRYYMNGDIDTGFGDSGTVSRQTYAFSQDVTSLAVLPGDAFIVSSFLFNNIQYYPVAGLSKYKADGSIDNTFGKNGNLTSGVPAKFSSYRTAGIAVQPDGNIVLAGQFMNDKAKYAIAVTRLLPNGETDKQFGVNGTVFTYHYYNKVTCMLLQQDGKILVGGCIQQSGFAKQQLSLVRYLPNDNTVANSKQSNAVVTKKISLYPNPVKDVLHISGLQGKTISIINTSGIVVKRMFINSDVYDLATNNFAKGVYYIKVEGNDPANAYSFIKQ